MDELVSMIPRADLLAALLLASALGGAIGLERELSGKPAGFRTNLLICVGAALLTELSVAIGDAANADPGRIAAQIVSGIGFLGAGTIIQSRGTVIGLTTAATLWVVSAIGIAVGAGQYAEAIGTTLLVLAALLLLGKVESRLIQAKRAQNLVVQTAPDIDAVLAVEQILDKYDLRHRMIELERREKDFVFSFELRGPTSRRAKATMDVAGLDVVRRVRQQD